MKVLREINQAPTQRSPANKETIAVSHAVKTFTVVCLAIPKPYETHGHTPNPSKQHRRRRTQVAPDPGGIHRGAPDQPGGNQADDVEFEDVRLPALPSQFQDRQR